MSNPKKVFVLSTYGKIETISFGLKTCYLSLLTSLRPDEKRLLKSYEQVWRIVRRKKFFIFILESGRDLTIERFDITLIKKFRDIEFHKSAYKR